ncbi:MAG: hypothetical protein J6B45_00620 [Clostridia bacterium]|nr:hypothetical protein [Clostridia bacterium]
MKKVKIASTVCLGIALILQILPFGVIMKWATMFERKVTYHSYFDLLVFGYGDIGPFFCAVLTTVAFGMMICSFCVKSLKNNWIYHLSYTIIIFVSVIFSLIPTIFQAYSVFGLFITLCLSVATELNFMLFINRNR